MKNKLFMYLFIFTLLLVIFQFVNSKNIIEDYDKKLTKALDREKIAEDSLLIMKDKSTDIYSFNFDTNDDAMTYWENRGFRISEFVPFLEDQLMGLNFYDTEDHPLVPYASMTENKMLIDQIKILNHKWIIVSFTDGTYWGEMLVAYSIEDKKDLKFKVVESILYQP